LLLLSSQGKEALYAVSDPSSRSFWITIAVLGATSFVQYSVFLMAVCGYYKSFSDRAMQGASIRLWSSVLVGLITPTILMVFNLATRPVTDAAPLASVGVWIALSFLFGWVARNRVRVLLSPFSAIASVGRFVVYCVAALIVVGIIAALAALLDPGVARILGPVALTMLGMTLWSTFWTCAVAWFERSNLPPTPAVAIAFAVLVSVLGPIAEVIPGASNLVSFHRNQIDLISASPAVSTPENVRDYARSWLSQRARQGRVRAVIILAEGGGIRAALQSATILATLDDGDEKFFDDVFVLSGVSGGSVGIASYLAARAERSSASDDIRDAATLSLRADHLSPVLAGMYFWDWPMSFAPIPTGAGGQEFDLYDRGSAFEGSLQEAWSNHPNAAECAPAGGLGISATRGSTMRCPFLQIAAREAGPEGAPIVPPIVLFNTTRSADGDAEIVSNVTFESQRTCNVLDRIEAGKTVSLATAAHLSARFPFVSPPGALQVGTVCARVAPGDVTTTIRYVDGGYLDNSGALSASQAVAALESVRGEIGRPVEIEYVVIHIFAQTLTSTGLRTNDLLPEITAPLDAVTGARSLQGLGPIVSLCRQIQGLAHERRLPSQSSEGAPGSEGALQSCDDLTQQRTRRSAPTLDVAGEFVLSAGRVGDAPFWIGAPLMVSDGREVDDEYFVPLGWLLGGSGVNVERRSCEAADQVNALLRPLTAPNEIVCDRAIQAN
jgi:hypothetical protein